jgi:RHS repeat-associated protein
MPNSEEKERKPDVPITDYVWDFANDSYLMAKDETGATTAVYTNEPVQYGSLVSQRGEGTTSYFHFDGQLSTRQLTESSQQTTLDVSYTAFGQDLFVAGTPATSLKYVGGRGYDSMVADGIDAMYVRNRCYVPGEGRWNSVDPMLWLDATYRNPYLYVTNHRV